MNKKLISMLSALSLCIIATGCSVKENKVNSDNNTKSQTTSSETIGKVDTFIELSKDINIDGEGATVEYNKIIITKAGTYSISGVVEDGQIVVNAGKEDKVSLILDNANITSKTSAPIYIMNAKKAVIALAEGTKNYITDGDSYILEDESTDDPNAAIFSKDDLEFIGNGSLEVSANYNNGITSKDDLKIEGGNITVKAVSDGLRGKDSIVITNGVLNIDAKEDGIKSSNTEDIEKGYINIEGGTININSGQDGIQGESKVLISNGDIKITSGGGSVNPTASTTEESESNSAKAIKATTNISIDGGTIKIDSSDDAIHSNDSLVISSGEINISSGDDGIHSDSTLDINGGNINITKSYEGIESEVITINDGEIYVLASDDGINAAGGNDSSSINGRPGQNKFSSSVNGAININGGYTVIDASGDGIDANGSIFMSDGVAIVNGPTNNGNGSLDYDGSFEVSGGVLVATGSLGMAQAPSQNSTQNSVSISLSAQSANSIVSIQSESGEDVITFAPSKDYQSVIVSSPKLKTGTKYTVSYGGDSTGTAKHGLYSGGKYSGGTKATSFTISNSVTVATEEGVSVGGKGGGKVPPRGEMQAPPQRNSTL